MFKLFKGKNKTENNEPVELPIEMKIKQLISSLDNKDHQIKKMEPGLFSSTLKNIHKGSFFSLCNGSDEFAVSILLCHDLSSDNVQISKQLNELSGLEVIHYSYSVENYNESLWSLSSTLIYGADDNSFFIFKNKRDHKDLISKSLKIIHNREFLFGTLLINGFTRKSTTVAVSYSHLDFYRDNIKKNNCLSFSSTIKVGDADYQFIYHFENTNKSTSLLAKELIKEQCKRLEDTLQKKIIINNAGILKESDNFDQSHFTLKGTIYTPGTDVPYEVIFSKRFLSLFPDYSCTTVKGKILQINKDLFRKNFDSFYKSHDELIFTDYISNLDDRDLNLISQNFFLSHSYKAENIKELFYFKVKLEEKSRIMKIPFPAMERFLNHLPVNFKERYQNSRAYSESHKEMIQMQMNILEHIFRDFKDGKLLLSHKSRYILEKELGSREKENKTRRLKKLISDKRFINYLAHMDNKKTQLLLSNMKNILIVDTFIYQTDELVKLKPFLSRKRFQELQEDIRFTQGKIKSSQIDINRICDSIENFNSNIKDFVNKEKENQA